jgi:MFS family permease
MQYRIPLDLLNFFLADVRGSLGPYLGIFLLTRAHWNPASIGLVTAVSGIIGLALNAPAGALIDATRFKRGAIATGVTILTASALAIATNPAFPVVLVASTSMAVTGDLFGPAAAAITLGIVEREGLARRLGRNAAFDHAGNVFIAALAGFVGWQFSQQAVFFLVPVFAGAVVIAVLSIPTRAINHDRARGFDPDQIVPPQQPASWRTVLDCKPLLILAVCAALFHFANAPMLPLVGQKLALAHAGQETVLMSACIIAAQLVMLPMAVLVGAKADVWGRKPILVAAFSILPIRGLLYTLSDARGWLVGVQFLDGVGAGIFGALMPLILADLTRSTGRYNVSQGFVAMIQGLGASLSNGVAGMIVVREGYSTAFLCLAAIAAVALLLLVFAMPETMDSIQRVSLSRTVGSRQHSWADAASSDSPTASG